MNQLGRASEGGAAWRSSARRHDRPRIAVVRALNGLGDMLCAVPALNAVRRANPRGHIAVIGMPGCRWMLERFGSLLDALLPFPGFPGIREQPFSAVTLERFLAAARAEPWDLAIQMHGSGTVSNVFTEMLGARATAGLYVGAQAYPRGRYFRYPARGSEIHRCLHLTRSLDYPSDDDSLSFPVFADDRQALAEHPRLGPILDEPFVCLHAGARDPARRWPPQRFARLGDALAARGFRIVLTGTADEREAAAAVAAAMRGTALDVAGDTSLGVAAALLEYTAALVTNDTGISHLAAASGTPSVVIFLASDPDRWAPLDRKRHRPVIACDLDPESSLAQARRSQHALPEVEEVLEEALAVLSGFSSVSGRESKRIAPADTPMSSTRWVRDRSMQCGS